jgi:thioredoxin 1
MVGDATYDQAKDQIKQYLLGQKRNQTISDHIAGLSGRYEVDVSKSWVAKQYAAAIDNPVDKARNSGMPSMVDFGADGCRPCDMLAPIIDSLEKEYAGKLNVLFVHVRKEQILATRYGVQSIPLQVFYDKQGKEVYRHVGFFPKDQIIARFADLGVK